MLTTCRAGNRPRRRRRLGIAVRWLQGDIVVVISRPSNGQVPMALGLSKLPRILEGGMMKAIVQHEYGAPQDVLKLVEVDTPTVGEREWVVGVGASGATRGSCFFMGGNRVLMPPAGIGGIRKPRFLIPVGD